MTILPIVALAAALAQTAPALAQTPKKPAATAALQKEFDGFIAKFRAALKANDAAAVHGMTRLPFDNNEAYRDVAQFRAKVYSQLFPASNRACLQRKKAAYERNPQGDETYFVFCGNFVFTFTKTPAGFLFTDADMTD